MVGTSPFTNALTPEEFETIKPEDVEQYWNALTNRYNINDEQDFEGKKLLCKFGLACALLGAKEASNAIVAGVKDLARGDTTGEWRPKS